MMVYFQNLKISNYMRTNLDNSKSIITTKDLQIELAPIKADLNLVKWMLGALIAIAIAGFSKQFLWALGLYP